MSRQPWCPRSGKKTGILRGEVLCSCGRRAQVQGGRVVRHRIRKTARAAA